MESENKILRQQTLSAPSKGASENPSALATKILENGHHADEDILHTPAKVSEIPESKPRRPPTDRQHYAGSAWDELKHIRQAVGFLVIHQKYRISYDEITNDLCPILSVQQLYRICTLYWDDNYNTRSVSAEVISSMRVLMTEDSNNPVSNSFLLDDSSSIPFSVDELSTSLQVKDFLDVKPAEDLLENPAFQFLHD
ncbi:UNVERIFIED_CONTAM: Myosin-6 [Sesamum radiatum]|uniref:Myosin-6 n=1 Tax=Sesamum radiatum TaxID=300843 RepID=A0AAW2W5Q9_SESRA